MGKEQVNKPIGGIDITGNRYGRLTAVRYDHKKSTRYYWLYKCDCGNEKVAAKAYVKNGNIKSCGCLFLDTKTKHGGTRKGIRTPTYISWQSLKRRCLNKYDPAYHNYGGRGVKVCDRWMEFGNFLDDMGERPEGTSLDRIDNEGDYEPSNCKWSSMKEQSNNRRKSIKIEHEGEVRPLKDWCDKFNLVYSSVCWRRRSNPDWRFEDELTHIIA